MRYISIHAPAWGATPCKGGNCHFSPNFNPRTRMGCDIHRLRQSLHLLIFQSTHPHGVRRGNWRCAPVSLQISIHAPAWGATLRRSTAISSPRISIHAPAWGATGTCVFFFQILDISIHAPAWGATLHYLCFICKKCISIHAPAWGATCTSAISSWIFFISIHAPAWGATQSTIRSAQKSEFQSTHPHGVRPFPPSIP